MFLIIYTFNVEMVHYSFWQKNKKAAIAPKCKETSLGTLFRKKNTYVAKCFCCEKNEINPWTYEAAHIIPDSRGGSSSIYNLIPSCMQCNRSMKAMNFFVFKSRILGKYHYDQNNFSDTQKNIIEFYNDTEENITCRGYLENFNDWMNIIRKNMRVETKHKKNFYINKIECSCGFCFKYVAKKIIVILN